MQRQCYPRQAAVMDNNHTNADSSAANCCNLQLSKALTQKYYAKEHIHQR